MDENKVILRIHFGALSDSIYKQLKKQKFNFILKDVKEFQDDSDSILKLSFSGLLNDASKVKLQDKLFKRIESHVIKHNKKQTKN